MSAVIDHTVVEKYSKPAEIAALVSAFESCTLTREKWTHRAHLTVAFWYLAHHDEAEATRRIRAGIKRFNHALGILTTKTSGYHETITLFYIALIGGYLRREARTSISLLNLLNNLLERYGDRRLLLEYYSHERLMSVEARATWVEPDLKSLS